MPAQTVMRVVALCLIAAQAHAETATECLLVEAAFAENRVDDLASLTLQTPRWQVHQQFRLAAAYIPAEQRRRARKAVLEGLRIANKAIRANPEDVEMLLMGAMLDGQILLLSPWRFFHNGLRGLDRLDRAEALDPQNPRAVLVRGTAEVLLPKFLGGDVDGARGKFLAALNAHTSTGVPFRASTLCDDGAWAQVDLLNWLGRANDKLANAAAAQGAYAEALARSPHNHWVKLAIEGRGYEWSDAELE